MNRTEVEMFQTDLKNGLSLEEALLKHNISFKEAVESVPRVYTFGKRKKKVKQAEKYIQQRGRNFYLRKTVNGKTKMFGTYYSLEDAIKVREHCEEFGWKQRSIDKYCKLLGVTRKEHHTNRRVRYS